MCYGAMDKTSEIKNYLTFKVLHRSGKQCNNSDSLGRKTECEQCELKNGDRTDLSERTCSEI